MSSSSRRGFVGPALAAIIVALFALLVPTAQAAAPSAGRAENGTRLMDGAAMYPRVIRLAHSGAANGTIIASVVTFDGPQGIGAIFESTDNGVTFERVGSIVDPGAANGLCCSTLYELPRQVGALPPGTLLWSASVGQAGGASRRMTLPLWASTDHGRTWIRMAVMATSPNFGGLWEPEFTATRDGLLELFVSDESQQPTHSQALVAATSTDGSTWTPLHNVVASEDPGQRPGMPVVRELPNGTYLMSYEVCGYAARDCLQVVRRSVDGLHWGDPTAFGKPIRAVDGTHFRHAPTISVYGDGTGHGQVLSVGQMLFDAEGKVAPGNGSTIFVARDAAMTRWSTAPAPVRIAAPYNNYCPNYSSSLLPLPERGELLELATGYGPDGACTTYFATGQLPR